MDTKFSELKSKQRGSRSAEFALLYGQIFTPSVKDKRLHEIAKIYHAECEAYDKATCMCIDEVTGVAYPTTINERRLINKHAIEVRDRLQAENRDLTKQEIHKAIVNYVAV